MTPAERVASELIAICFAAGVAPSDDSEPAARQVCAAVEAELRRTTGGVRDIVNCAVQEVLARRLPEIVAVVGAELVTLPRVVVERVTGDCRRKRGERVFATVPLPAAIAAAVALFDTKRWVLREAS